MATERIPVLPFASQSSQKQLLEITQFRRQARALGLRALRRMIRADRNRNRWYVAAFNSKIDLVDRVLGGLERRAQAGPVDEEEFRAVCEFVVLVAGEFISGGATRC